MENKQEKEGNLAVTRGHSHMRVIVTAEGGTNTVASQVRPQAWELRYEEPPRWVQLGSSSGVHTVHWEPVTQGQSLPPAAGVTAARGSGTQDGVSAENG